MLKLNHLTGFGSGAAAAAGGDVTSYVFDGANSYLSIADHADLDFPNGGDFTIEFFVRLPSGSPAGDIVFYEQFQDSTNYIRMVMASSGAMDFQVYQSSSVVIDVLSSAAIFSDNTWHHFAICRDGNDWFMYVDGTDVTSSGSPDSDTPAAQSGDLLIGVKGDISGDLIGHLDEYRISDTCRYPSGTPFTPTTTQFTSDANTLLLIHGGEAIASGATGSGATFVDSGNTGHTVTENGNAQRETEQEFKFTPDATGYFFDGDPSTAMSVPNHADWDLFGSNSDNWTISLFARWTAVPTASQQFFSQSEAGGERWSMYHSVGAGIKLILVSGSSAVLHLSGGTEVTDTDWHHIAVCKVADEYGAYIDGVQTNYLQDDSTDTFTAQLYIASLDFAGNDFPGYMDEMLIEQSNVFNAAPNATPDDTIVVPTTQHTPNANTKLLIHGGEAKSGTTGSGATFTDSGNTGHTVTENGNAIESTGNFYKF